MSNLFIVGETRGVDEPTLADAFHGYLPIELKNDAHVLSTLAGFAL
jgi:hypothetical protein